MNVTAGQLLGRGPVLPATAMRISPTTRWSIGILGLALVLALSVIATHLAQDPLRFPVTNVDILGTVDYEDRDTLMQSVQKFTGEGFYGLDIDDVRRSVETLPWIAHARVSRVWPSRIEVTVEEHEPAARWNDNSLISKRLELFVPPQLQLDNSHYAQWREVFSTLPQLMGAEGRHSMLLDSFRDYARELSRFGVSLDVLREDERRSQTLELSSQVTVRLGYEDRELRMDRFLDVYERLIGTQNKPNSTENAMQRGPVIFDMRYSNGFALSGLPGITFPGQVIGSVSGQ